MNELSRTSNNDPWAFCKLTVDKKGFTVVLYDIVCQQGGKNMILCINCSTDTKAKMDSLLAEYHYSDYSELLAVAVENLLVLNREVGDKGALVIGEDSVLSKPSGSEKPTALSSRDSKFASAPLATVASAPVRIPDLFLSEGLDELPVFTLEIPPTENNGEMFSLDRWLFGQYNKLLPAKANCRALVCLTAGQKTAPAGHNRR
jgi:hypothetical protein